MKRSAAIALALVLTLSGCGREKEPSAHDYRVAQCLVEVAINGGSNADADACDDVP